MEYVGEVPSTRQQVLNIAAFPRYAENMKNQVPLPEFVPRYQNDFFFSSGQQRFSK